MSCTSRIPYDKWRLQVLSELFLPSAQAQPCRVYRKRNLSTNKTFRNVRTYGTHNYNDNNNNHEDDSLTEVVENQPVNEKLRPSDSLPKSPLFKLAETRPIGHRPRKPQGTKADDARLRDNPWAVALASPLRYCSATAVRIPKAFLTEMNLVRRVDEATDGRVRRTSLWWMPAGLVKEKISSNTTTLEGSSDHRKLPVMRMVTRALLMEYAPLARNATRKVKPFHLVPSEWRMRSSADISKVELPERLTDLVFKYLRRKVVKSLKEAYRYERMKSERADQWRILNVSNLSLSAVIEGLRNIEMENMRTGAVVIVGDSGANDPFDSNFPDYLTLPQTQSTVPVIDLSTLLSASDRQALREAIPRFAEKALFFRPDGPKSVDAMLAMWELKGYVMHDSEHVRDLRAESRVSKEPSSISS